MIMIRNKHGYLLPQTGNADQTPTWFAILESTTKENVGKRSVQVRMTGADKHQCIMMLAVSADGYKLPPFVIFRRKTLPKIDFCPKLL
jgi:hypothetical protein